MTPFSAQAYLVLAQVRKDPAFRCSFISGAAVTMALVAFLAHLAVDGPWAVALGWALLAAGSISSVFGRRYAQRMLEEREHADG